MQKGSVNKAILIGHVGQDPESRFTPAGTAVTNFSLATNESWRGSDGEMVEHTEWHRCVLFGKTAEIAKEFMTRGQLIYLEGRLKTRDWEDKDGIKRYTTEIVGNVFTMLGKGKDSRPQQEEPAEDDDDLPF